MLTRQILASACVLCSASTLWAGPVDLEENDATATISTEQFRDVMLEFVEILEHDSGMSLDLFQRIEALNDEELTALYKAFPDPQQFADVTSSLSAQIRARARRGDFDDLARETFGVPGILPGNDVVLADYPSPGGAWFDLLGTLGLANDERCDPDFEAGLATAHEVANIAAIIAQALCDALVVVLGEGTNAPACVAAGIANEAAFVAEYILEQCRIEQEHVDSAEIAATYENSLLIVEGLTCVNVEQARQNHGCNGNDDDCDGVIDECDEDTAGPIVHIDPAVLNTCYKSANEAAEAIALAVLAFDDCGTVSVSAPVVNGTECDVTVDVTATDDCGNSTTASTSVTIDGGGATIAFDPMLNAPGVCYDTIEEAEQAVLGGTTITDNCSSMEDLTIQVHSSVTECGLRVRIDVTDDCGNETSAAITVRVDDADPEVEVDRLELGFRGEVLGFQTPVCYDTMSAAMADVLAVTDFEDNCSADEDLMRSVTSDGNTCALNVTAKAVDECLNEGTDSVTLRVDALPPMVTCSVAVTSMWPANHTMQNVGFTFQASDNCTTAPSIDIFIRSDETTASADGAGQASPAPDAFVLRDLDAMYQGILLRAERSSEGNGRIYEITVRATDECGNVGSCSAQIGVPASTNKAPINDGQYYDATQVN